MDEFQLAKEEFMSETYELSPKILSYFSENCLEFALLIRTLGNSGRHFFCNSMGHLIEHYRDKLDHRADIFLELVVDDIPINSGLYSYFISHFLLDHEARIYTLAILKNKARDNTHLTNIYQVTKSLSNINLLIQNLNYCYDPNGDMNIFLKNILDLGQIYHDPQPNKILKQILLEVIKLYILNQDEKIIDNDVFVPSIVWVLSKLSEITLNVNENFEVIVKMIILAMFISTLKGIDLLDFIKDGSLLDIIIELRENLECQLFIKKCIQAENQLDFFKNEIFGDILIITQ